MLLKPYMSHAGRQARGFTLVELMLVVIVITVLATLASPLLIRQWRERHGRQAALQVMQTYSEARMQALAQGAAVMVTWSGSGSPRGFRVLESIEGTAAATARGHAACADQPGLGCLSTDWTNNSREVSSFDTTDAVDITGKTPAGAAMTQMSVCFTPLGRSFVSFDGSPPTTPMVGAATFEVRRMDKVGGTFSPAGQARTVVVMPNGMARLAL